MWLLCYYLNETKGHNREYGARQEFDDNGVQPERDCVQPFVVYLGKVTEVKVVEDDLMSTLSDSGGLHTKY